MRYALNTRIMKMITKKDLNQDRKPCEKKERRLTMNGRQHAFHACVTFELIFHLYKTESNEKWVQ